MASVVRLVGGAAGRGDRSAEDATLEAIAADGLEPDARAEIAEIDNLLWDLPVEQRIAWVLPRERPTFKRGKKGGAYEESM